MVSSYQGQAKAETNQGPVVLGVFIISMTLSIFVYLSIIWSILRLCSEFRAFNGILHCFFTLQWYPATKDRPRLTQTKNQWSLVSYHINIYDSICHFLSISHIVHPAHLLGVWCVQRSFALFFFRFSGIQLPATKDRPRRTQTKDQRSLVPWPVVRGAYC